MTTVDILANTQTPIHARMLINGEWVDGAERLEVRNPARPDDMVGTIVRATPQDVDRAVAAAKDAQRGLAALGYCARGDILARCLDALDANIDARAHRSQEHTSELHSLMPTSDAVFCLK